MKQYIGTKTVKAEPMSMGDAYRKIIAFRLRNLSAK